MRRWEVAGGQSGASLLRLQPQRHTVIRSTSVHRSCQLLPPSEASRCSDACLQTSAVRHQPGCWRPDPTPSTPPEILIVCHEGLVRKEKRQVLDQIYHLCFNTSSLDSSVMCKVHTLPDLKVPYRTLSHICRCHLGHKCSSLS